MGMYQWELQYYTDYPIIKFGDKPGRLAPMREIEILSYDGNKYCTVKVIPSIFEKNKKPVKETIKSGYIYKNINRRQLKK